MTTPKNSVSSASLLAIGAATVLGISAGSMLNEEIVLVSFWRSLPAQEFLDWYADNAQRLSGYYGPLQIAAALSAIATAAVYRLGRLRGVGWFAASSALAVLALMTFFLYFKDVNASFAAGTIATADVPAELARWSTWQWGRTAIGIGAFVCALIGIRSSDG